MNPDNDWSNLLIAGISLLICLLVVIWLGRKQKQKASQYIKSLPAMGTRPIINFFPVIASTAF